MKSGKNLEDMKHVVADRSIKLNNHLKKLFCIFYGQVMLLPVTIKDKWVHMSINRYIQNFHSFIKNNTKLQTALTGEKLNIPLVYLCNGLYAALQNCQLWYML